MSYKMSQEQQIAIEERFARVFNDKSFKERLSSADFEKYINGKKRLSFQKHDTIFEDGETPKGVFVLEKGAKLSKSGAFGKDQILRFIKEGISSAIVLCFAGKFQAKAEAMTDIECVFLPADIFMYLLEVDPQLVFVMLQKISYELGESSNTITFLAQKTVRERLAEIFAY
jgi:CRP-like cAMP-binding protein